MMTTEAIQEQWEKMDMDDAGMIDIDRGILSDGYLQDRLMDEVPIQMADGSAELTLTPDAMTCCIEVRMTIGGETRTQEIDCQTVRRMWHDWQHIRAMARGDEDGLGRTVDWYTATPGVMTMTDYTLRALYIDHAPEVMNAGS